MPVKNLIPALPEHGKIKAGRKGKEVMSEGGKKFRLPEKLDHYLITTTERDAEGDYLIDTRLMQSLKDSGEAIVNKAGEITGIPIRLLYNDIDLNCPTRYAKYKGVRCVCSGDGETAKTILGQAVKCPCPDLDAGSCKINGKLFCLIEGTEILGACHVLRTTSINTVKSLLGSMAFIRAATGGLLAFLPLHLMLMPRSTVIPSTGAPTTIYVSSIVFRGAVDNLQRLALEMAREKRQYLIEMDSIEAQAREIVSATVETPEEEKEIAEEFYPETAASATPTEASMPVEVVTPEKKERKPREKKVVEPVKQEPEKPAPKPDGHPQAEPEKVKPDKVEAKLEVEPAKKPEAESVPMISIDQKRAILQLKKDCKISDPRAWTTMLEPYSVQTANLLTFTQAENFIRQLEVLHGDIPF